MQEGNRAIIALIFLVFSAACTVIVVLFHNDTPTIMNIEYRVEFINNRDEPIALRSDYKKLELNPGSSITIRPDEDWVESFTVESGERNLGILDIKICEQGVCKDGGNSSITFKMLKCYQS